MDAEAIRQGRAHDAAMTAGEWVEGEYLDGTVHLYGLDDDDQSPRVAAYVKAADAAGIVWMRDNLRDLLDAAEERDRLQAEVKRLSGLLADARWDLMP